MYYKNLCHLYQLSKTLRFELRPIGRTAEHVRMNQIIKVDEKRKEDYKKVKLLLDKYHREVIESTLSVCKLSGLAETAELYYVGQRTDKQDEELLKSFKNLRKEIVDSLKKHENFGILFKKELIEDILPKTELSEEEYDALSSFKRFTTYFKDYNKVRENLYSLDEKSSTVAFRMIHENLPKFLDNCKTFKQIRELNLMIDGISEEEIDLCFQVEMYDQFLTQGRIDFYNMVIGKMNMLINLTNQQNHKNNIKQKYPKMKELFKQILSDREQSFIEEFESDDEVLRELKEYETELNNLLSSEKMEELMIDISESKGEKLYIKNDTAITTFSNITLGSWQNISSLVSENYDVNYTGKKKGEKYEEEKKKNLDKIKSYDINEIQRLYGNEVCLVDRYVEKLKELKKDIQEYANNMDKVAFEEHDQDKKLSKNNHAVETIKEYLDSVKELEKVLKLLNGSGLESDKNEVVYGELNTIKEEIVKVDRLYNLIRNYVTRKPYSTDKFKLNFNSPTFLDGWDKNKEESNLGILFTKDDKYYLGIMKNTSNKIFRNIPAAESENVYRKVTYKLLPGPNKMLPKVFFGKSNLEYYQPSDTILQKYQKETHKKGDNFSLSDCHNLIDFFKDSIDKHEDWKNFGFKFSETSTYEDISAFYKEVEQQGYSISYSDVDASYIDRAVEDGSLYLFEIYNKDFSTYSKGNLNLHTIYFKMLFDERNLNNIVYKLNGEAEVFYRPASIMKEDLIVHKANDELVNKNIKHKEEKKTSIFKYDIVKDKRFSEDKFMIHIPITLNFGATQPKYFNNVVNEAIREEEDIRVIGIDRGERNLLYVVVVDSKGNILHQKSLNEIVNKDIQSGYEFKTDYHSLLDEREGSRDQARKNWKTIESIKELKEGYLSQVTHYIAELILEYNAIVVLEDLNFGFMRGRQKVEKQVYQKFEKMLIDKLNYLVVDKSRSQENPEALGGALNAFQLTNAFTTFKSLGKQTGCLFYVPAYLTSKIDPTTGFANLFYVKYENMEKAKKFFANFDKISYNTSEDYFEFAFDYSNFTSKAEGTKTKWTVCSYGERILKFRNSEKNNQWDDYETSVTSEIKGLFSKYDISYEMGDDLREKIAQQTEKEFFSSLIRLFNLTLQMRNSSNDGEKDYIISPVKNERGEFFISSKTNEQLPVDADANGAYNIARKGLWVVEQIKNVNDVSDKLNLAMTNKQWLQYAQEHTR